MAQVPFSGVPSAAPTGPVGVNQSISANPGQFGALVGQAEQGFGGQLMRSSEQVAHAAAQLQDFNNTQAAREANNTFLTQMGDAYAEYASLEGKAAYDGYKPFQEKLKTIYDQTAGTLQSPMARESFESSAKFAMTRMMTSAAVYAASQNRKSFIQTNNATIQTATQQAMLMQNDPNSIALQALQARNAARDNAIHMGLGELETDAYVQTQTGKFYHDVILSKLAAPTTQGGGPEAALALFNSVKDRLDPHTMLTIQERLKPAVLGQEADQLVGGALVGGAPATLKGAIRGQEGSGPNQVSVNGAVGSMQVTPAFFKTYAKPGEKFENEGDRVKVAERGIDALNAKYNGDQARVAVAYFSGPGNVSPAESPNPWIEDKKDGNGTSTSAYVRGVLNRVRTGGGGAGQGPMPDWSAAEQRILDATEGNPDLRTAALSKLNQTKSRVEAATATERYTLQHEYRDVAAALEAGIDVPIKEDRIRAVFPPAAADEMITNLNVARSAGEIIKGLQWGSPEEVNRVVQDLSSGTGLYSDQLRSKLSRRAGSTLVPPEVSAVKGPSFVVGKPDGLVKPGNLDLNNRPTVKNPDGSISTVRSMTVEMDGKAILLPTVIGGKVVSEDEAFEHFRKTGENLGTFDTEDNANAYAEKLHEAQAAQYAAGGQTIETAEAFGMRKRIAAQAVGLINARQKTLDEDPARYVATEPTVALAAKQLNPQDPSTYTAYARTTQGVQQHLGVPASQQHILTMGQAQGAAAQLMAPGTDVRQQMQTMQAQWGQSWPKVLSDLVRLGKLPAGYQSVAVLDDPKEAALLSRALQEQGTSGKSWGSVLGDDAAGKSRASVIRQTIDETPTVQQWQRSLANSGANRDQIKDITDSVVTLAYAKAFFNGMDPQLAATQAVDAFIKKYQFLSDGQARIPQDQYNAVTSNAALLLSTLKPESITIPQGFRPTDSEADRKRMPAAPSAEDYVVSVVSNPTWTTTASGDAMILRDNQGRIVRNKAGEPITVHYDWPNQNNAAGARLMGFE